jgi:hypothetical protein
MAEAEQAQPDGKPAGAVQDAKNEPSIHDVLSQLEEVRKAQSGSDKKVKELSDALMQARKEKEELEKERMTDKDRAKYEIEQERTRNAEIAQELKAERYALDRANVINELQIPKGIAPFIDISGKDKSEMAKKAAEFMKVYKEDIRHGINTVLVTNDAGKQESGEQAPASSYKDKAARDKIYAMKPGPDKDAAIIKMFESFAGQDISTYTG